MSNRSVHQDEVERQTLRNQLVIMQTLSQMLPVANMSQVWLMNESQRTSSLLSRLEPQFVAGVRDKVVIG
jgi:hypothetical protein